MERTAWTDERLDDFRGTVEARFDHVDTRFDRLEARIDQLSTDLRAEIRELRTAFTRMLTYIGGGIIFGLLGVITTLITQG